MTRQKIIIASVVVAIGIALFAISVSARTNSFSPNDQQPIPSAMQNGIAYMDHALLFFNGNNFVTYNYTTGLTKTLGKPSNNILVTVDSMAIANNKQYLLFHTNSVSSADKLGAQLLANKQDTKRDYWWVYNILDDTYRPIQDNLTLAKWDDNSLVGLSLNNGSGKINTYDLATLISTKQINVPLISDFYAANGTYYTQTTRHAVYATSDGITNQQLYSSMDLLGVDSGRQQGFGIQTDDNGSRNLVSLNLQKQTIKSTIAKSIVGSPVSQNSNILYVATVGRSQPTITNYDLATGRKTDWQLQGTFNLKSLLSPGVALVSSDNDKYFIIGNGIKPIKFPDAAYERHIIFNGSTINVSYVSSEDAVYVQSPFAFDSAAMEAVNTQLAKDGLNAALLRINYVVSAIDYDWPYSSTTCTWFLKWIFATSASVVVIKVWYTCK